MLRWAQTLTHFIVTCKVSIVVRTPLSQLEEVEEFFFFQFYLQSAEWQ